MKHGYSLIEKLHDSDGAVAILVGVMLVALLGFAALAIDVGHMFVVQNELQNGADAGALAGAAVLYINNGTAINTNTEQTGRDFATSNESENIAVEVDLGQGDVQRGHWCFTCNNGEGEFTPNNSTVVQSLIGLSALDIDTDTSHINAVRVRTRREAIPADNFLAGIFGRNDFTRTADAVAYIGFAGTLGPGEADQPIAICEESILKDGKYVCNVGTMISDGNSDMQETGAWTNFEQGAGVCQGGTNDREVRSLVCGNGNPDPIKYGEYIGTNNGQLQNSHTTLRDCWLSLTDSDGNGSPDQPWNMTLPVILCGEENVTTCGKLVGAVNVNVLWISGPGESTCNLYKYDDLGNVTGVNLPPLSMADPSGVHGDWSCSIQNPQSQDDFNTCWDEFVDHFNLLNYDDGPAPCQKKTIYFMPDCEEHPPAGNTGGNNFGVRARIPVLVE